MSMACAHLSNPAPKEWGLSCFQDTAPTAGICPFGKALVSMARQFIYNGHYPYNLLNLRFEFQPTSEAVLWTSEARRQASVWIIL